MTRGRLGAIATLSKATMTVAVSFLMGCGGGSGGDAAANGPSTPPPPPSGGEPPGVKVTDSNVVDLADFVFLRTENLQLNAELMASAAALLQRDDDGVIEYPCTDENGIVTIEHVDADSDAQLSANDQVRLTYACDSVTGRIELRISELGQVGAIFDDLGGSILMTLEIPIDGSVLRLDASQNLVFSIGGNEIRWSSLNGRFSSVIDGVRSEIADVTIQKAISEDTARYDVSFTGTGDFFGERLTFRTTSPFRGVVGNYPDLGIMELRGNASAADVLHGDTPDTEPSRARFRVDSTGSGTFGTMYSFDWSDVANGVFFEIGDGDIPGLPSGGVDVTPRTSDLGGTIHDGAMDAQRNLLYFSITDRNEIAVVDGESLLVIDRVFVGAGPRGIWLSDDTATLYVALSQAGAVSALDLETRTLQTISVAQALGTSMTHDVVEASPGVLFVTGSPGPLNASYVARVDRANADQVTRVADGRSVGDAAGLFLNSDRSKVYVGQGLILLELDPIDVEAPVVADGGAQGARIAKTLSISPDGATLYFDTGAVRDATTFERIGNIHRGIPYALPSGHEVALVNDAYFSGSFAFQFDILSSDRLDRLDRFTIDCGLSGGAAGVIPLRDEGQWLFYAEDGICAADLLNPNSPPGSDGEGVPPSDAERVSVSAIRRNAVGSGNSIYDGRRQRLLTEDNGIITSFTADTLELVDTYDVGGDPAKMELSPSGGELAIVFSSSASLGFLEIDTAQLETVNFSAFLNITAISDVAYLDADTLYLSAWAGSPSAPILVRASRSNATPAARVFPEAPSLREFSLIASADLQRLYASTSFPSPGVVFSLDTSDSAHPLIAETEATVRAASTFGLSPDGSLVALGSGELFTSNDLTGRAHIDGGALGFSGDSRQVAIAQSAAELHIFSTTTFTKTLIVETDCGQAGANSVMAIPEQNAWVIDAGNSLCRFSIPGESQKTTMSNQKPSRTAFGFNRYYCNDDCLARKHVVPRVLRAFGSKLDRSLRVPARRD